MVKIFFVGAIPPICFHPETIINFKSADQYYVGQRFTMANGQRIKILKRIELPHSPHEPYVRFPPHCFAENVPFREVTVTRYHMVKFKDQVKFAEHWLQEDRIGEYFIDPNNNRCIHFIVDSPESNEFIDCNGLEVYVIGLKNKYPMLIKGEVVA